MLINLFKHCMVLSTNIILTFGCGFGVGGMGEIRPSGVRKPMRKPPRHQHHPPRQYPQDFEYARGFQVSINFFLMLYNIYVLANKRKRIKK